MNKLGKRIAALSPVKLAALEQRLFKNRSRVERNAIVRRVKQVPAPLSFAQERLWFLDQLEPGTVVYSIPLGLRLKGALNVAVLQRCLDEILRRHEALRTRFEAVEGQPHQVVEPTVPMGMPLVDFSSQPEERREEEALRLCTEDAHRSFDLAHGPLVRAKLFRLGQADHIFFLNMHHIASDGWSHGIAGPRVENSL